MNKQINNAYFDGKYATRHLTTCWRNGCLPPKKAATRHFRQTSEATMLGCLTSQMLICSKMRGPAQACGVPRQWLIYESDSRNPWQKKAKRKTFDPEAEGWAEMAMLSQILCMGSRRASLTEQVQTIRPSLKEILTILLHSGPSLTTKSAQKARRKSMMSM